MAREFAGQTCGIYPRVSTRKQAKNNRSSLKDQEEACRDYATENEMVVDEACVKPEAYTSTVMKRPELNQLLAEMKARQVHNLIIDRADRMTRAGQLVAATFLKQFTRAGITLHIVAIGENGLVVRDDKGVKDFLDAAYQAQQDNKQRTRIIMRARRSRARAGHYIPGNHQPYGYHYALCAWDDEGNVTDKRLEPDTRAYAERGFATTFAANPFEARKRIVQLYAEGHSFGSIAQVLSREGVPTSTHLLKLGRGTRIEWWPRTVRYIAVNPLNEGILTNFRQTSEWMDPDDRHEEEWLKERPVPLDKQVIVTPVHGPIERVVDERTALRVALRQEKSGAFAIPSVPTKYAGHSLMAGGVAKCVCGGTLRVNSRLHRNGKTYLYYRCQRGKLLPTACPGLCVPVGVADEVAWEALSEALTAMDQNDSLDNYLDILAATQAQVDVRSAAADDIADLKAARAMLQQEQERLTVDLGRVKSESAHETLLRRIDQLGDGIAEANRKIAANERQAARVAERRAVLADTLYQYHRYIGLIGRLDVKNKAHVPILVAIARAVGARFTVSKDAVGRPEVSVELLITPASAAPWFNSELEQLGVDLDSEYGRVIEKEHPPFVTSGSSPSSASPIPATAAPARRKRPSSTAAPSRPSPPSSLASSRAKCAPGSTRALPSLSPASKSPATSLSAPRPSPS